MEKFIELFAEQFDEIDVTLLKPVSVSWKNGVR